MDMEKRNEARTVVNTLNAEAMVRLAESQNAKIAEQTSIIDSLAARLSAVEQEIVVMKQQEFARMAAQMGSGSTVV